MANTLRIKRRASGSPGAPTSLANAELAYNEVDDVLYYGKGTAGAGGTATTIPAIAGAGAYLTLSTAQTVSGSKTFTGDVIVPTQLTADNSTKAASTAFVKAQNYLTGNQTITFTGDATGSGTNSVALTLANSGVTAGTYTKITFNAKGLATAGSTLAASDIPTLTAAKISDFDTQVRTNRLDQLAAPTADVTLNSRKITNLADPVSAQDAATKAYVDATKQGLDVKDSCRAATTANITLNGTQTVDGIALSAGDRVLVKNQTTASENGLYTVVSGGAWTRTTDADTSAKVTSGMFTFVETGTTNADSGWVLTTDGAITLGTTALAFTQFSGAGQITAGAGLTKTGNTLDVVTASASRIVVNADSIDLATTGVGAGTYKSVTVDTYGRITAGTNPTTLSGYGIVDAQPLDATLTALAGVTTSANQLIYATGSDAFTTTSLTAFGRSILDDADASAGRTTLGLGTIATQNANNVAITGGTIDGIDFDGGVF
jgi:phage-related tail fiber protein